MKLSILAAAIGITVSMAEPTLCWGQSIVGTTTPNSPLVADCQALADDIPNILPGTWIPTQENNDSFDAYKGTCGFRAVFNQSGSNLPGSEMRMRPTDVIGALQNAISSQAVDGRASATGSHACMIAGWQVQVGWVKWEIYKVTSCQRKRQAKIAARRAVQLENLN